MKLVGKTYVLLYFDRYCQISPGVSCSPCWRRSLFPLSLTSSPYWAARSLSTWELKMLPRWSLILHQLESNFIQLRTKGILFSGKLSVHVLCPFYCWIICSYCFVSVLYMLRTSAFCLDMCCTFLPYWIYFWTPYSIPIVWENWARKNFLAAGVVDWPGCLAKTWAPLRAHSVE